ncbi:MAG TPA: ABC transporter substrate-binding protein [Micromonosporaceae bacterium]|nr:ABC transporter substrate-binding protein [Micromonosporaceae bacterium]
MSLPRRHRLVGVLAAVGLAFSSAACGSAEEPAGAAVSTRSVTDATGVSVAVPTEPKRVIALSEQDLDGALALGVTPVGTVNGRGQTTPPKYLGDQVTSIAVVGDVAKPTMDKLVAAQPDLILAGSVTDAQILADLRKLAPTVVTYKPADDWKQAFTALADALGKSAAAKGWLAQYDAKVTEAKAAFGANAGAEVSIVRWNPQGPGIMQTGHFASLVAADLGLKRPAGQQEPGFAHSEPLSLENLGKVDAGWLFVGTLNPAGKQALDSARAHPAYQQLKAVRAGKVVDVDGTVWTSRGGPAAALLVVADIRKTLAG